VALQKTLVRFRARSPLNVLVRWLQTNHLLVRILSLPWTQETLLLADRHLQGVLAVVLVRDITHMLVETTTFLLNLMFTLLLSHHL